MIEIISALLLCAGALFMAVATIGVLRLPDLYLRMHAITKAGTLGVALVFVSVALFFGELDIVTRALLVVAFAMLTAPVSAHMIGRAGYLSRVPLWSGTLMDQLKELYPSPEGDAEGRPVIPSSQKDPHQTQRT